MTYSVTPKAYLARAKLRLLSGSHEELPYAALELRSCIEARQGEYYRAYHWRRGQKIKHWKVTDISRKIHEHWSDQKIAQITYHLTVGDWITYFTPVRKELAILAVKNLGDMLHALSISDAEEQDWWSQRRQNLSEIYREAWLACRGEHLAMPLWDEKTGQMHPVVLTGEDEDYEKVQCLASMHKSRERVSFSIDYLDEPPKLWVCDLDEGGG